MHTQQGACDAGWHEDGGHGMAPRKMSRGGPQASRKRQRGNAAGVQGPDGSSPGRDKARGQEPPGVGTRGRPAAGCRGNVGEPRGSVEQSRCRRADR